MFVVRKVSSGRQSGDWLVLRGSVLDDEVELAVNSVELMEVESGELDKVIVFLVVLQPSG